MNTSSFALGSVVMTPGAGTTFTPDFLSTCLNRHRAGDWGDLKREDKVANDAAVNEGERILSSYTIAHFKLWIITEADRSATTLLLPDEY